ncbi:hypothetical protein [Rhodococcus pyridinivorans]|uniref:hypothetical protein n=2 Tax=Rhodococcus TaxID=1827 RepID=UPI00265AA8AE|nr:hypothetical protein [Rhodococcus pyridinivorans]
MELHDNMKPEVQPICAAQQRLSKKKDDLADPVDYRDVVVDEITAHLNSTMKFGGVDEEEDRTSPAKAAGSSLRFTEVKRDSENVRFRLAYGAIHVDGTVLDPEDATYEQKLRGKATVFPYRASLIAREGHTRGILAIEVRGRSCPLTAVVRGLKMASDVPWRLKPFANLADRSAMENFIRRGEIVGARFEKWSFESDGQPKRRAVEMAVHTKIENERVKKRAARWFRSYYGFEEPLDDLDVELSNEKLDPRAQAKAMRDDIFTSTVDIEFDTVSLDVLSDGVKKTISPASDFRKFTYILGTDEVSDGTFYHQCEQTAELMLGRVQKLDLS